MLIVISTPEPSPPELFSGDLVRLSPEMRTCEEMEAEIGYPNRKEPRNPETELVRCHDSVSLPCPFHVLVDGREKAPYTFQGIHADADKKHGLLAVATEWAHLRTGDYTILGMENLVTVERKSLEDLYSTLGQHRERFEDEHRRMAELASAAVIIEADWATILNDPPERSKLLPKAVFRTALSWMQRYGVPWMAMGSRRLAEVTTFRFLEKFHQHHTSTRRSR
jgi:DNA excision repair protein ERCC-4